MLKRIAIILCVALSGCVAGQSIKLNYTPDPSEVHVTGNVSVDVKEAREYVTNGDKKPWYIGHYRAGFGNTWDVVNDGDVPLADQMQADLVKELEALGFRIANGNKKLLVQINEWNFDTYMNGDIWYVINVKVLNANGTKIAESSVKDKTTIKGSFWVGAKYAMEDGVPKLYSEAIRKMVRENSKILNALKAN